MLTETNNEERATGGILAPHCWFVADICIHGIETVILQRIGMVLLVSFQRTMCMVSGKQTVPVTPPIKLNV